MTVPHFTKGYPLLASDLNALADAACANIIGGAGCAVKRIGKRVIVEKRVGQIVPKGVNKYGTIYKLRSSDGQFQWAYDTGAAAYSVFVAPDGVYVGGERNNNWSNGGEYANLWKLSTNGRLAWAVDTNYASGSYTRQSVSRVVASADYVFAGSVNTISGVPTAGLSKLDAATGEFIAHTGAMPGMDGASAADFCINSDTIWLISSEGRHAYPTPVSSCLVYAKDFDFVTTYGPIAPLSGDAYTGRQIRANDSRVICTMLASGSVTSISPQNVMEGFSLPVSSYDFAISNSLGVGVSEQFYNGIALGSDFVIAAQHQNSFPDFNSVERIDATTGAKDWDFTLDGLGSYPRTTSRIRVAIDESVSLCFAATPITTNQWNTATGSLYRDLFALNLSDGSLVWHWNSSETENDPGDNILTNVESDNNGYVYCTSRDRQEPFAKIAD